MRLRDRGGRAPFWAAAGIVAFAASAGALPTPVPQPQDVIIPAVREADVNAALNLTASAVATIAVDLTPGVAQQVVIPIEGQNYVLDLWPHSVRAPDFRLIEHLPDGTEREVDPGPVNTLRGTVQGLDGSVAAGGVMPDGLYLTVIFPNGSQYWIEPIFGRVAGAGKADHAVYRNGDSVGGGFCGTTDDQRRDGDAIGIPAGEPGPRGLTLWTAQMGTDADVEFYLRWGGTGNVNSRIALVTNTMNLQYERDVDIRHVITTTRVRTAEPDPYSSTVPATLNAQLVSAWSGESFTNVDVVQLFTGKEMDGGTIGRANAIGSICGSQNSSCWSQSDFNNNFSSATDLSAHELGHLWDGVHCTCSDPPSTMNPFITSVNRFGVNGNDTADTSIPAYRNTRACLSTAGSTTAPPNDDCASPTRIFEGTYGYNNNGATNDGPAATCGTIGDDIWYLYIAPCDGTLTVDTCFENNLDSFLVAYTGSCGSLTQVACNDDTSPCPGGVGTLQSRIQFAVTGGTSYRIRLGGFNGLNGLGYLTVDQTPCAVPANNTCAGATTINANTDIPFSTFGATTDGGLVSGCNGFGDDTIGNDIWYRWVATCTADVTVQTCGSLFDTKLGVYSGCPGATNQIIGCNDDSCGLSSSVTFAATTGTAYLIRVGGFANNVGTGTLRVVACPPPANDSCGNAINVSAGGTFNGTLVGATNDGTATCGSSGTQPDVWYSFTASCAGTLRVTTCGTHDMGGLNAGMDTVLSLHTACGGVQLDCNDDTNTCGTLDMSTLRDSAVSANLMPGQTVLIRASRFSTVTARPFVLNVSFPGNDLCENASVVGEGSVPFCNQGAATDGPAEVGLCNQFGDIWYRFTATCNAPFRVSTCGANYDSEIAIYPAGCPAVGPAIACNDDSCFLQSNVTFAGTSGTSYLIRVGAFGSGRGSGTLVIRVAADWNNDGVINSNDISAYLSAWLASLSSGDRNADFNNDNLVNSNDISAFLSAWLAALSGGC